MFYSNIEKHKRYALHWAGLIAALTCLSITTGCTKSESASSAAAEVPAPKPLQALFSAAPECFKTCVGHPKNQRNPDTPTALPEQFADFLENTNFGRDGLLTLVKQWPESYMPLAVRKSNERDTMGMEGSIAYVIDFQGVPIIIYTGAGFPDQEWYPGPKRRVPGSLTIAVNPKTKTMAAIFNGQEDLSEYRFAGDSKLLAVLIAYQAAHEAEGEKAYLISAIQQADDVVFPTPSDRLARVEARLSYLNSLYAGDKIIGARSYFDAGDKLREGDKWYSPDSTFTQCFNSGGPAAKLDSFVGFTDKPYTHDVTDSSGRIVKVEVINASDGGGETVWTYYKNKSQCEAEQINSTKSLADKYR